MDGKRQMEEGYRKTATDVIIPINIYIYTMAKLLFLVLYKIERCFSHARRIVLLAFFLE